MTTLEIILTVFVVVIVSLQQMQIFGLMKRIGDVVTVQRTQLDMFKLSDQIERDLNSACQSHNRTLRNVIERIEHLEEPWR